MRATCMLMTKLGHYLCCCNCVLSRFFSLLAPIPQFFSSEPVSYDKDSYVAHKMSAIAHLTVRYVTMAIHEQELMQVAEISLRYCVFSESLI